MKDIKDNFSNQAQAYAQFRPGYPAELFDYIFSLCKHFDTAWDCATGNGQAAVVLADRFANVQATDISEKQLSLGIQKDNIHYNLSPAYPTTFADNTFDLITVAQALHWFGNSAFYNEVKRVGKDGALVAAWGYGLMRCNKDIDIIINEFYTQIVGPYWDEERKHVDNKYLSLPFPFDEVPCPEFSITYQWRLEQLIGYLNSWSSVQHYINKNARNPTELIEDTLRNIIDKSTITVCFPIFLRAGYIK